MLYDFINAPRNDALHAVYYLQGTPQDGEGIVVQLVAEEDLDGSSQSCKSGIGIRLASLTFGVMAH